MYPRILKKFQQCILEKRYIVSMHALDELDADSLTVYDIEAAILNGSILERQKDLKTQEFKYRLKGNALAGQSIEIIAKLNIMDNMLIITVYQL